MPEDSGPSDPAVFVTHDVVFGDGTAVKRFRSADHDEPRREWRALTLLARYAPGLAPEPVSADLDGAPPVVVMSRLPGQPLGGSPLCDNQLDAAAAAMNRLHHAVPPRELDAVPPAAAPLQAICARIRAMAAARPAGPLSELQHQARRAGLTWLDSFESDRQGARTASPAGCGSAAGTAVFAHVDGNLANYLWDGCSVRLVDFEDSGRGDRAQELADFVEHLSVWDGGGVAAEPFLDRFELTGPERERIAQLRRLFAVFWSMMLLPGGRSQRRNPPGTADRQASRALALLG